MAEIKEAKISDLVFDDKNFNKHTEYGMSLIEKSIRNNGAGRSILIDKNNRIIAGNGVVENAGQIGMEDIIIVPSDGTKIVAVQRTDIDLDSKEGREMALADNATAAVDLEWDADTIADVSAEFDIDVSGWGVVLDESEQYGDEFTLPNEGKAEFGTMTFTVNEKERELINDCLELATYCDGFTDSDNKNANGAALSFIAKQWLKEQKEDKPLDTLKREVEDLRQYLRNALKEANLKAVDIDNLLGTCGMSGHYFGESQWMFPTREAYEKMQTIMPLERDYFACKKIEKQYNKAIRLNKLQKKWVDAKT